MKNRREFLKIFGTLTAAGAALVTVGAVGKAAPLVARPFTATEKAGLVNASDRVTCPADDIYDLEPKWMGGPAAQGGTLDNWRKVWGKLANEKRGVVTTDPPDYHWVTPDMQERMVDNVFKSSPLFKYLTSTGTVDPKVDTITISEVDSDTNLISSTNGTSFTYKTETEWERNE